MILNSPWVFVGIGGFLGAISRYELGGFIQNSSFYQFFPKGTLIVNILGSLILGFLFTLYQFNQLGQNELLLFGTGFCGAFTTFSTFVLETVQLEDSHGTLISMSNIGLNLFLTLIGVYLGIIIGNLIVKSYLKI